ncbi:Uncharacterised protein [Arcanobacterium haemolyticum]|uniref:hypothetical protein n=1 Tax=Arcanobacterium haemolyticum TaxID=28264 RepID=UPI000D9E423F|nr:hypothetical protein [Arcanobacterium haemolyticum]SPT75205.1 Uncharacterised protein [Arcanobacterium haemolyticum]
MAFIDLIQQLADESSPLIDRAGELRVALAADPNDAESFEELASIIRKLGQSQPTVDPLTADDDQPRKTPAHLVLWALAEDLASDSRAWYPLLELAKLAVGNDPAGAVHHIDVATGREESGLALETGIQILVDAGHIDTALQVGIGQWNPDKHSVGVGIELSKAALAAGKIADAKRCVEILVKRYPGNHDVLDLRDAVADL